MVAEPVGFLGPSGSPRLKLLPYQRLAAAVVAGALADLRNGHAAAASAWLLGRDGRLFAGTLGLPLGELPQLVAALMPARALTGLEIRALLPCPARSPAEVRDLALLVFLLEGIGSAAELAAATWGDVTYSPDGDPSLTQGPGPARPIPDHALEAMIAQLEATGRDRLGRAERLFVSDRGDPLTAAAIGAMVGRRAEAGGICAAVRDLELTGRERRRWRR